MVGVSRSSGRRELCTSIECWSSFYLSMFAFSHCIVAYSNVSETIRGPRICVAGWESGSLWESGVFCRKGKEAANERPFSMCLKSTFKAYKIVVIACTQWRNFSVWRTSSPEPVTRLASDHYILCSLINFGPPGCKYLAPRLGIRVVQNEYSAQHYYYTLCLKKSPFLFFE